MTFKIKPISLHCFSSLNYTVNTIDLFKPEILLGPLPCSDFQACFFRHKKPTTKNAIKGNSMEFWDALEKSVQHVPQGGHIGLETNQDLKALLGEDFADTLKAGGHMQFRGRFYWLMRRQRLVDGIIRERQDGWDFQKRKTRWRSISASPFLRV